MSDFSIIQTGGKQYKVSSGEKISVEKLPGEAGASIVFDKVLLRSEGGAVTIGAPYIVGATVTGMVAGQVRGKKQIVFKYHSKTRQRKKKGHRQSHTEVTIG